MLYCIFHWFVKLTGWIPQRLVFQTRIHYEDRAVQGRHVRAKAIVVSNHHTVMDFAVLMFVFWTRTLRCAVAEIMYQKNMVMTLLLKLLGCIRVERESYDFSFLDRMKRVLDKGGVVELYPESRLAKPGEEKPLPFKPSYVYLALQAQAPIIPVYSNGKLFSKERVQVVIGKPIDVRQLYDNSLSERENIHQINAYVRSKIIALGKQLEEQR